MAAGRPKSGGSKRLARSPARKTCACWPGASRTARRWPGWPSAACACNARSRMAWSGWAARPATSKSLPRFCRIPGRPKADGLSPDQVPDKFGAGRDQVNGVADAGVVRRLPFTLEARFFAFAHHDRVAERFDVARRAADFGILKAAERLLDGARVEDGDRRPAVAAGVVPADIDRGAAAHAANDADLGRQFVDFGRVELADEALFDHELGKGREAAVFLQAAMVVEAAAVLGDIQAVQQALVAARAVQRIAQRLARVVVVLVQQFEQPDDAAGRDLHAFKFIEPDALAGKAQIEDDLAVMQALEALLGHRLPAGRAGRRLHQAGRMVPRFSLTPFFILPTTCISQALQSNLRISFSLPLISVIGSGFRCLTSLGQRLKL